MFMKRFSTLYLERRPVGATWITGAPGLRPPLRRSAERDLGGDSCEISFNLLLAKVLQPT